MNIHQDENHDLEAISDIRAFEFESKKNSSELSPDNFAFFFSLLLYSFISD